MALIGIISLLALLGIAFWVWVLFDCIGHEPSEGNDKIIWILIIILLGLLGALMYYFSRRPKRIAALGE